MSLRIPFQFKKPDEDDDLKLSVSAMEAALQVAGDRARECLSHEDFQLYREDYKRAEIKLIDLLIKYNKAFYKNGSTGIEAYAMNISSILTKLESLRSLLEVITVDAKKGFKNEKS